MKKILIVLLFGSAVMSSYSCGDNKKAGTHTHDDGSTHEDHDTTKPQQQEFSVPDTVKKDSAVHSHGDGKPHSH